MLELYQLTDVGSYITGHPVGTGIATVFTLLIAGGIYFGMGAYGS